jgi:DNA polymerase
LIVRLNAPFFKKRFAGMSFSILTPDECMHWNGAQLSFTAGVSKSQAPDEDELEILWKGYYRSIFNPARVKIKMMQTEMPKKYWKNLPEAEIIEELIRESSDLVNGMMEEDNRELKPRPTNKYLDYLDDLNDET